MKLNWLPLVIAGLVLAGVDTALWVLADKTSGEVQKGLIPAAATVAGAIVAVVGTSIGAYLTASFAFRSARQTDRRATYVTLLHAVSAYQIGRRQSENLRREVAKKETELKAMDADDPGRSEAVERQIALSGKTSEAHDRILQLFTDVNVALSGVQLLGPDGAAAACEELVDVARKKEWNDTAVTEKLKESYEKLREFVQ